MALLVLPIRPRRRPRFPRRTLTGAAVALALAQYGAARAGPAGAQVAAGQAAVPRPSAAETVVTQSSPAAIVNWRSFSVGPAERVEFRQPDAASVILNRVVGGSPSGIDGQLSANGKVFLVNPSGIVFGRGARVDVGGLVASTLDIADADFLAGRYRFATGAGAAGVINRGRIHAAERGTVALLGATVNNEGVITAQLGTAAMAAGGKVTIDFSGDGLTKLRVDEAALKALVVNHGMVVADGGQAIMTAQAAQALGETVLDQQGVVRARSLVERNGRILLDGGDAGVARMSGTLDVSGPVPGRSGGTAQVLGHHVGLTGNALVDARGDAGGGTVLAGGDAHGANPDVRKADAVFAGPATRLLADATGAGPGGKVVLWSTNATRVYGKVSAAGGPAGGDGGFVETSGKFLDVAGAAIGAPARAVRGARAGRWLLDPFDVTIVAGESSGTAGSAPNFVSGAPNTQLSRSEILNVLNAGTDVTVTTGSGDTGEPGDINVNTALVKTGGGDATLTLNAARNITFNVVESGTGSIGASAQGGRLNVDLNADADGVGGGAIFMNSGTSILTNGGNVRMYGQSDPVNGRASALISETPNSGIGVFLLGATVDTSAAAEPPPIPTVPAAVAPRAAAATPAGGSVLIRGQAPAGSYGVSLEQALVATGNGSVSIDGTAGAEGQGVSITGTGAAADAIRTGTGSISISGSGGSGGVALAQAQVRANTDAAGQPGGPVGASLTIAGTGGVSLSAATLSNEGGPIALTGIGGLNAGVALENTRVAATGNGGIDVRGRATGSAGSPGGAGVLGVGASLGTAAGPIAISGEALGAAPGISFDAASIIGSAATGGDITLRARNSGPAGGSGADMIVLDGTVRSGGALALLPGGVSETGALTEAPAVPIDLFAATTNFALNQAELTQAIQPGFARVTIGSATHTGPITVAGNASFAGTYDLTLQNGGPGSQGIALQSGLSNPGRLTILSSGGTVTQGGPITSASLLLHGTQPESRFALTNPANTVGRISAHFEQPRATNPDTVSFANSGDLEVAPLAGAGFDAATNAPLPIAAPQALAAGNLFLQTGRDLILGQNIAAGGAITLVAGRVLNNAARATLAPGGAWTVFADTWIGEQAGGLAGSAPTPNLYNCAFGAACASALPAGNHFVYRQQPRVDIALVDPNPARQYGSPNPAFPFTASAPAKSDDANAVSGGYATAAGPASNVQSYPILGDFGSPAGYQVVAAAGTLRVDPAVLTYVAQPAFRVQGDANPPLTGSVTGLVAGDTLAGATTGTLGFTTPAGTGAVPGRYPVVGGGLSAVNYIFRQAPGNAVALAVVPPTLFTAYRPDALRDVTYANTELYGQNVGLQPSCPGTGPLARADASSDPRDLLSVEWSRVRDNPNLSNCVGLVRRYSCDSF